MTMSLKGNLYAGLSADRDRHTDRDRHPVLMRGGDGQTIQKNNERGNSCGLFRWTCRHCRPVRLRPRAPGRKPEYSRLELIIQEESTISAKLATGEDLWQPGETGTSCAAKSRAEDQAVMTRWIRLPAGSIPATRTTIIRTRRRTAARTAGRVPHYEACNEYYLFAYSAVEKVMTMAGRVREGCKRLPGGEEQKDGWAGSTQVCSTTR